MSFLPLAVLLMMMMTMTMTGKDHSVKKVETGGRNRDSLSLFPDFLEMLVHLSGMIGKAKGESCFHHDIMILTMV